jgi:hypothetical protein
VASARHDYDATVSEPHDGASFLLNKHFYQA